MPCNRAGLPRVADQPRPPERDRGKAHQDEQHDAERQAELPDLAIDLAHRHAGERAEHEREQAVGRRDIAIMKLRISATPKCTRSTPSDIAAEHRALVDAALARDAHATLRAEHLERTRRFVAGLFERDDSARKKKPSRR